MSTDTDTFASWAVLELMGHRRLAGWVTEQQVAGAGFVRIDIPDGPTQLYGPQSVYCITPTTEDIARRATIGRPAPIQPWELAPGPAVDDEDLECGLCGAPAGVPHDADCDVDVDAF